MSDTGDRLGAQAKEVSNDIKEMGHILKDAAQQTIGQVRENATAFYEQRRDRVQSIGSKFTQYVRDRPVKSLLIAAGVGLLLGRFATRR